MSQASMPHIAPDAHGTQTLFVDGQPFMVLGGEIHNSSASGIAYMKQAVWPYLKPLNLNTVIIPVYWEMVESIRGQYDFSLAGQILQDARAQGYKLIFLWFGLWKNGESTYVPGWMKDDPKMFFPCRYRDGKVSATISPFCRAAVEADKGAFVAFMEHLKEADKNHHTVIMVQLENEIGFLGSDNDYCDAAKAEYEKPIPDRLAKRDGVAGTWRQAYGEQAVDYFLTWHFAAAMEEMAAAGKRAYPLPIYINAWLELFPFRPGTYPTGGPIGRMLSLWQELAPSIDLFAPDIYHSDLDGVCRAYVKHGNPLFIPEARRDQVTVSNAIYVFAAYNALGFSPFGAEDFFDPTTDAQADLEQLNALQIDALAFHPAGTGVHLQEAYRILQSIQSLYFEKRHSIVGFCKKNEHQKGDVLRFSSYDLMLTYHTKGPADTGSAGMIIPLGEREFYIIGCNTSLSVLPKLDANAVARIEQMEEGAFENSVFQRRRILNGDELRLCRLENKPTILKIKVGIQEE